MWYYNAVVGNLYRLNSTYGNLFSDILTVNDSNKKGNINMAKKITETTATEKKTVAAVPVAEAKVDAAPVVKEAAKEEKPAAKKPAAKKTTTAAKKPAAKKTTAKKEAKVEGTPDIVALAGMLKKKIGKKNVSSVNEKIAVEIKVYGDYEAYMYILIDNGTVTVEPYGYMDNDIHIDMPIADVLDVIAGKYDFAAKALSGDFYALGSLTKMLKVKKALF